MRGLIVPSRTLKIQPKYMLAMHNLAMAYLAKKDLTRARFWLREALDIAPDDGQLRALKTRVRFAGLLAGIKGLPGRMLRKTNRG